MAFEIKDQQYGLGGAEQYISHTLFQLSMNRVICNRLLFMTLIIICESEIREIYTSLAIGHSMHAGVCTRVL